MSDDRDRPVTASLQAERRRCFQQLADAREEPRGVGTVQNAVIAGEGDGHLLPNHDLLVPVRSIARYRSRPHRANRQNTSPRAKSTRR